MRVIYPITRWTNASRATARHIPDSSNRPLCGNKRMKHIAGYEAENGEPTCKACIRLAKQR